MQTAFKAGVRTNAVHGEATAPAARGKAHRLFCLDGVASHVPPTADAKSITFRPAVRSDAHVVATIVNGAYRGDATGRGWTSEADLIAGPRIDEAGFLALLAKDASVVLLGLRDGDIVGCVHLEGSEDGVAFLGMLSVRVSEQGSGLGRALVAAAEDYARRELGARVIAMYVLTVRRELLAWYERRGYRRTGDIVPFHSPPGQRFLRGPLEFERLEKRLA